MGELVTSIIQIQNLNEMKRTFLPLAVLLLVLLQGCSPSLNSYRIKFDAPKHKKAAGAEAPENSRQAPLLLPEQADRPEEQVQKTETLGVISFSFGLTLLLFLALSLLNLYFFLGFLWGTAVLGIPGGILGMISVFRIRNSPEKYRKKAFSWIGLLICSTAIAVVIAMLILISI